MGLLGIALGVYAGILLNQRYRMPHIVTPGDVIDKMKASMDKGHNCEGGPNMWERYKGHQSEGRPNMWERFKEFEKQQRKEQSDETKRNLMHMASEQH